MDLDTTVWVIFLALLTSVSAVSFVARAARLEFGRDQ